MTVKERLNRIAERVDAMSLRERGLIFVMAVAVLYAAMDALLIGPQLARERQLSRDIAQRQGELRLLEQQIATMARAREQDPDREARTRLERIKDELASVEQRVAEEQRKFTTPAQMKAVVEELVARNRRVELVSLSTLPLSSLEERGAETPAPAAKPGAKPPTSAEKLVYRHGVVVTLSGAYLDLLAYLADLEGTPTQIYWGALDLTATEYPKVVLKLTLYTLSLDKAWMNV